MDFSSFPTPKTQRPYVAIVPLYGILLVDLAGFDNGKLPVREGRKAMGPLIRIARFPKN